MKRIFLYLILFFNLNGLKIANQPTKCDPKNPKDTQMCKSKYSTGQQDMLCIPNEKLHDPSLNSSTGGYCGYRDENGIIIIP